MKPCEARIPTACDAREDALYDAPLCPGSFKFELAERLMQVFGFFVCWFVFVFHCGGCFCHPVVFWFVSLSVCLVGRSGDRLVG